MKRWKLILFACVCFGAGAISATVYEGVARGSREGRRGQLYAGFSKKLDLSIGQRLRLDEIVEDARQDMVTLSRETKPRFGAIKQKVRGQIREILDAKQLSTFKAICTSWDRRRQDPHR